MPPVSQVRFLRTGTYGDVNYIVFESAIDGSVKLKIIDRTQVDFLVSQNNQMDIINSAQTILSAQEYGGGNIRGMDLYVDQGPGIVRLSIVAVSASGVQLYMGRIDGGNWMPCANTPVPIDGTLEDLLHVNGNSNEVNFLITSKGSVYCEGH